MESARKRKAIVQSGRALKGLSISVQNKRSRTSECLRDWANLKDNEVIPRSPVQAIGVKKEQEQKTPTKMIEVKSEDEDVNTTYEEESDNPFAGVQNLDELERIHQSTSCSYTEGKVIFIYVSKESNRELGKDI
tara:strand:- start:155 stop:556 length:402 start_codon:yes stop_codon:yes gene_type:complete